MPYRKTPAVQERLLAVRERIAAAGLTLVAERGYAGCSVSEIATRAEVAVGTLYRHFPNKGELFAEVFRTACAREVAEVVAAGDRVLALGGCPCQGVLAAVEVFGRRALLAPRLAYALMVEPADPLVDAERIAFRQSFGALLATLLRHGIEIGHFPEQDATLTAAGLIGATAEALIVPLVMSGTARQSDSTDQSMASLLAFVQRALGGRHDGHA